MQRVAYHTYTDRMQWCKAASWFVDDIIYVSMRFSCQSLVEIDSYRFFNQNSDNIDTSRIRSSGADFSFDDVSFFFVFSQPPRGIFGRSSQIKRRTTAIARPLGTYARRLSDMRERCPYPAWWEHRPQKFPEKFENSSQRSGEIDVLRENGGRRPKIKTNSSSTDSQAT